MRKRFLALMISLCFLLQTSFGGTVTIIEKNISYSFTKSSGNRVYLEAKTDSNIQGWSVTSGNVTLDENNSFEMPETGDVVITALYPQAQKYMLTVENFGAKTSGLKRENTLVTASATSKDEYEFVSWSANGIELTEVQKVSPSIVFIMPSNEVTLVANYKYIDYIIENKDVALGAYITYEPSETLVKVLGTDSGARASDMGAGRAYETTAQTDSDGKTLVNQIYNPSSTTSWRVLKNNNGQLDIISTESIGDLTLRGATGYAKAVYTLNKLCKDYINPTYANDARSPGYVKGNRTSETADTTIVDGSSLPIIDTERYPLTYEETYTNGNNGFPYTDSMWTTDRTQINTAGVLHSSGYIWFASRYASAKESDTGFSVIAVNEKGSGFLWCKYVVESGDSVVKSYSDSGGVRPIVSLKSKVKITGGEGTADSPYTISIDSYTITYDANGGSGAPSSQTKTHGEAIALSETIPTKEGYTFKGWATSNTATTVEYSAGSEYTTDANLSLYAVWEEVTAIIANENVELGAYITYVPSKDRAVVYGTDSGARVSKLYDEGVYETATETDSRGNALANQIYNPSNTRSWRVLKNNNGQLDIISTESIGWLTLTGGTGYSKAVYTLNKLCKDYINPAYADDARNPGYVKGNRTSETADTTIVDGSSLPIIDTERFPLTYEGICANSNNGFPYGDTLYSTDTNQINTAEVLHTSGWVWLASRRLYLDEESSDSSLSMFYLESDGSVGSYVTMCVPPLSSGEEVRPHDFTNGVRPIVSLKSGIKIIGGNGTAGSPYTISIDSSETYTITYDANGGSGAPSSQTKTHGEAIALSETIPTKEGYTFKGWATSNTATTAEYASGSEYTTNANISLYAVWKEVITEQGIALGAYITYVPSKTRAEVLGTDSGALVSDMYEGDVYETATETDSRGNALANQIYNPSNTTSWRVLKNNNGQLDIISTESIGWLTLRGATGYAKAVYTLNKLCKDYINPTYADDARNPGYVKGNRTSETADTTIIDGSSLPIIDTTILQHGVSGFPYTDQLYSTDINQISAAGVQQSKSIWLASRDLLKAGDMSDGYVRYLYAGGGVYSYYEICYLWANGDVGSEWAGFGVRPIVSLKSGIQITGGNGTADSPYTISITQNN